MSKKEMEERYSVWQFFADGERERVRHLVPLSEAVQAARHYTNNVSTRVGFTERVIIVDGGDLTVFEWRKGEGVVFPKTIGEGGLT